MFDPEFVMNISDIIDWYWTSCMWSISRHNTREENEDSTGNGSPDYTQVRDPLQGDRSNINSARDRHSRTHDTKQLNRIRVLRILQSKRLPGVRHQLETRYLDFVQRDLFEDNDYDQRTVRIQAGQETFLSWLCGSVVGYAQQQYLPTLHKY